MPEVALTLLAKIDPNAAAQTVHSLEQLAKDQDSSVPVSRIIYLEESVSGSITDIRSTMLVFSSFAGAAILLAAVGIYGLMSYWVSQRTYEIGLRVAVGCSRGGILSMILARGARLTLYGVICGLFGALLLTRFLGALLFGVAATDVLTFVEVTGLVLGVGVIATAFPAWRAARIDPMKALRAE
jgi:putative ABC transport system permease protein